MSLVNLPMHSYEQPVDKSNTCRLAYHQLGDIKLGEQTCHKFSTVLTTEQHNGDGQTETTTSQPTNVQQLQQLQDVKYLHTRKL